MAKEGITAQIIKLLVDYQQRTGISPQEVIGAVAKTLLRSGHLEHVSTSHQLVHVDRKKLWDLFFVNDCVTLKTIAIKTGLGQSSIDNLLNRSGRVWVSTMWKIAVAYDIPLESICDCRHLKGVITWEDTSQSQKK